MLSHAEGIECDQVDESQRGVRISKQFDGKGSNFEGSNSTKKALILKRVAGDTVR